MLNLASVVEQAVANTQEMSASIVQVAGNADRVRQESSRTDQQVRDGRNEVATLSEGMASISDTVADVVGEMQSLDGASRQIGEILGMIEAIADHLRTTARTPFLSRSDAIRGAIRGYAEAVKAAESAAEAEGGPAA